MVFRVSGRLLGGFRVKDKASDHRMAVPGPDIA